MNKKLFFWAGVDAVGVAVYATLVSSVMTKLGQSAAPMKGFFAPAAMLMLLVLSVAVVGLLIFGRPVWLYLAGDKTGAWVLLLWTLALLAVITVVIFLGIYTASAL